MGRGFHAGSSQTGGPPDPSASAYCRHTQSALLVLAAGQEHSRLHFPDARSLSLMNGIIITSANQLISVLEAKERPGV